MPSGIACFTLGFGTKALCLKPIANSSPSHSTSQLGYLAAEQFLDPPTGEWDTKWMKNGNWELCESFVETEVPAVWWLPLGLPAARSTMWEMLSHCHTAEMLWSDDQKRIRKLMK